MPNFLKQLDAYKCGDFDLALKNAFLGFDGTLLEAGVIEVLKVLAGERNMDVDSEAAEDDEDAEVEDLAELREEGSLPLPLVLQKYKGVGMSIAASAVPSMPSINKLIDGPSGSKPQSPFLRGRRNRQDNGNYLHPLHVSIVTWSNFPQMNLLRVLRNQRKKRRQQLTI